MSAAAYCGRAARSGAGAPPTVQLDLTQLLPATMAAVWAVWLASQQPRHRHACCSPAERPSASRVPTLGDGRDAVAERRSKTREAHLSPSFRGSAITSGEAFSSVLCLERLY